MIEGMMPTRMMRMRSSNLLDRGPIEPKDKRERTPPDASRMPRYRMVSLFDQPKLSLAMGVKSLKIHQTLKQGNIAQLKQHSSRLPKDESDMETEEAPD